MTQPSVWDDPAMKVAGEFVKFERVGDSATGIVTFVKVHTFDDGKTAPQIFLAMDDGSEKALTAGAGLLKASLSEKRPEPGDRLTVTLTSEEPRPGGKTLRHWDVRVEKAGSVPTQQQIQQPPPVAPQAPVQQEMSQAEAAAALANLSPEQRKMLGIQ